MSKESIESYLIGRNRAGSRITRMRKTGRPRPLVAVLPGATRRGHVPKAKLREIEAKMRPILGVWARQLGADLSTFHLTPAMLRATAMQDFPRFRFLVRKALKENARGKKA